MTGMIKYVFEGCHSVIQIVFDFGGHFQVFPMLDICVLDNLIYMYSIPSSALAIP